MKTCSKCNETLPTTEFYKTSSGNGATSGKCKACTRKDVLQYRKNNHEKVCAYDRARFQNLERKRKVRLYQKTRRRSKPEKMSAHLKVRRAIASGKIVKPEACQSCGKNRPLEAHHEDYSRPLDVVFVCLVCHRTKYHGQKMSAEAVIAYEKKIGS